MRRSALHLVLTLRNAELRGHSGQVSFPGGRQDPEDASLALYRPARDLGGDRHPQRRACSILGELPCFYIPTSHFDVFPTVARLDGLPAFTPNPAEVADVFCFGLDELLNPGYKQVEQRRIRGIEVRVPYYAVGEHKVWGATAIMLSELECRLRSVLPRAALHSLVGAAR